MKDKICIILRKVNFILLIIFLFIFKNEKIMSNFYIKILFNLTLFLTGSYAIKDVSIKIKNIFKTSTKYIFFRVIPYILSGLLMIYICSFTILNILKLLFK